MFKQLGAIAAALFFSSLPHAAMAEVVNDVSITNAPWLWNSSEYAEPSYVAFRKYKLKQNAQLAFLSGDYYVSFAISPNISNFAETCDSGDEKFRIFLKEVFGTTRGGLAVTTLSVTRGAGGLGSEEFIRDIPLFYAGKGIDPATKTESKNGCFFYRYPTLRAPFVRYEAGSNQDFTLDFKIMRSNTFNANMITTLKDLLTGGAAAYSIPNPLAASSVPILNAAANDIQRAVNSIFTNTRVASISRTLPVKAGVVYNITSQFQPNSKGYVLVYLRRTSSFILDQMEGDITVDGVMTNSVVGSTRCIPFVPTPSTDCKAIASPVTFGEAYTKHNSAVMPSYFDLSSQDKMKKVYDTCLDIRYFSSGILRLSTLDALLVRWAAVKQSGLDRALADPEKRAEIAKATGRDPKLLDKCWNPVDAALLAGIATAMQKKIED